MKSKHILDLSDNISFEKKQTLGKALKIVASEDFSDMFVPKHDNGFIEVSKKEWKDELFGLFAALVTMIILVGIYLTFD